MAPHRYLSTVAVVLGAALLASAGCRHGAANTTPISAAELAQQLRSGTAPLILDVRTPAEYAAGHIPGAINIPHTEIAQRLKDIPAAKSAEIVVHCQGGGRAAAAERELAAAGYTNLRDLTGHMKGWQQGGFPVDR